MKKIILIIFKVLERINKLLPKNEKAIVLYSNLGFRDNIGAFYDYLISKGFHKKYKVVVASNDYKSLTQIPGVKYVNCVMGVPYFLVSKYFFYAFGKYPIMPSERQVVINLWHGMPLKKIGNLEKGKEKNKYDYFSYILSTGTFFDEVMQKSFNCESDRILHVGQPRTDAMFFDNKKIFSNYSKLVIWMPTFRNTDILHESNSSNSNDYLPLIDNQEKFEELNELFCRNNSLLVIKLHPIQSKKGFPYKNQTNIQFIDEEFLKKENTNLYQFLSTTNCLITDYSSVYFDYLLLNKPIIFTVADLADYESNRGLNFNNLQEMMPGEKVDSYNMFTAKLKDFFDGVDKFNEERTKVNKLFNEYVLVNNCKAICDFCDLRIENDD